MSNPYSKLRKENVFVLDNDISLFLWTQIVNRIGHKDYPHVSSLRFVTSSHRLFLEMLHCVGFENNEQ